MKTLTLTLCAAMLAAGSWAGIPSRFDPLGRLGMTTANWWDGLNMSGVWRMDDGIGTNIAPSVGSVSGSLQGPAPWVSVPPTALYLNNNMTNFVSMGDNFDIGTNSLSFGAWIRATAYSSYGAVVNKGNAAGGAGQYSIYLGSTGKSIAVEFGLITVNLASDIVLNDWLYVAATSDRSTGYAVYTNGVLAASGTNTLSGNSNTLDWFHVGKLSGNITDGSYRFIGNVRDVFVKISPSALSSSEVISIYSATRATYGK